MIINVEFLCDEPVENIITSLNFKVDKTIFFGSAEMIEKWKIPTKRFLKNHCGVKDVKFYMLPQDDLNGIVEIMRGVLVKEDCGDHKIFFDVTGGEGLPLIAFGILSKEISASMHMYDIEKNLLFDYGNDRENAISTAAPKQCISLNIAGFIEMQGGIVNDDLHKDFKNAEGDEGRDTVNKLWELNLKYIREWNHFSYVLRSIPVNTNDRVDTSISNLRNTIQKHRNFSLEKFKAMLFDFANVGMFVNVSIDNTHCRFQYASELIKRCLWDSGSVLELQCYYDELDSDACTDCRVGVHLDWDGMIHTDRNEDVINEIDVISLHGNIPTFISCKSGCNVDQNALYELEAVARRLGGKYVRKKLVLMQELGAAHRLRAEEMGIEVVVKT